MRIALINTLRCDLKCAHCLRGYPDERSDFPMDLLPRLLVEAKPFGATHVGLTGGEPHLHPHFAEMVEMIAGAGYTWSVVSNGLRTAPYLPLIERFGAQLTGIALSIDGATPDTHNAIRGRADAFDRVVASAREYVARGVRLKIMSTLNRRNQGELEQMGQLAVDLGAQMFGAGALIPTEWNQHLLLDDAEREALYQRLVKLTETLGIEVGHPSALKARDGVAFCGNLTLNKLAFNARGEMVFCCDTVEYGAVIGSLRREPLARLIQRWLDHAADLQKARAAMLAQPGAAATFDACRFCNAHFAPAHVTP